VALAVAFRQGPAAVRPSSAARPPLNRNAARADGPHQISSSYTCGGQLGTRAADKRYSLGRGCYAGVSRETNLRRARPGLKTQRHMQIKHAIKVSLTRAKKAACKDSVPCFDLERIHIQFCSAAKAERIAKEAVLCDLRLRAKSAGKRIHGGIENILGPDRCQNVRWLWATLQQMSHEFAAEIDEAWRSSTSLALIARAWSATFTPSFS
jgi:hypothetical protein